MLPKWYLQFRVHGSITDLTMKCSLFFRLARYQMDSAFPEEVRASCFRERQRFWIGTRNKWHSTFPQHLFPAPWYARNWPQKVSSFIGKNDEREIISQDQELKFHIPNFKDAKNVHSSRFYHLIRSRPQRAEYIILTEVKITIYGTIPSSPIKATMPHFLSARQSKGKCACIGNVF